MTVFARSDVCYVALSADHGGCGTSHSRPVVAGAPARVWALTCHACEDALRKDPLWAPTPTTIPETPDEVATREDAEKRGQVEQAHNTTLALQDLAKLGDLPQVLSQFMAFVTGQSQLPKSDETPLLLCKNGHSNKATATYCGDCGTPMIEPVSAYRGQELGVAQEPGDASSDVSRETAPDLESMSIGELRDLAKTLGVKTARSKDDQIAAIREASAK